MNNEINKPIIGFSCGDLNGIGIETIIKALADPRMLDQCTPVIFASNKSINFYRKGLADINFTFNNIKELLHIDHKVVNVLSCWEDEVSIAPGTLNEIGGLYAKKSLTAAVDALKAGEIHGLVTAPIHKKNVYADDFQYTGHTPYLKYAFEVQDVLMFMVADNMRVGLVTEHVPICEVANYITKENILSKLKIMQQSLTKDFGIDKPKIAVLGLNPHAGDEGLVGSEEEVTIKPTIADARKQGILAFGPYSADAFFAREQYLKFDGVLAMYHDQGLIPFKSLALGEGVNYTAGISGIRTSPDHGTAFDIAGKGQADGSSLQAAIFMAVDIFNRRNFYTENRANPLRKMSGRIVNGRDEVLRLEE